MRLLE